MMVAFYLKDDVLTFCFSMQTYHKKEDRRMSSIFLGKPGGLITLVSLINILFTY